MVIKYINQFESIFYAVLLSNLTGYFLIPKQSPDNLFETEPYLDIEKMDWQEIIKEHDRKFGQLQWLKNKPEAFYRYKRFIDQNLQHKNTSHLIIINSIRTSIKFGLEVALGKSLVRTK